MRPVWLQQPSPLIGDPVFCYPCVHGVPCVGWCHRMCFWRQSAISKPGLRQGPYIPSIILSPRSPLSSLLSPLPLPLDLMMPLFRDLQFSTNTPLGEVDNHAGCGGGKAPSCIKRLTSSSLRQTSTILPFAMWYSSMPPTGRQVTMNGIDIVQIAGNKLVEHWAVFDQMGMLQQLGVIPAPGQSPG
jgi:hypothetical protein